MNKEYTILAVFDYSTEAQVLLARLKVDGIKSQLMDEKTVDSDPLISQAIGGVKVLVHNDDLEKAARLYNDIRIYEKDEEGGDFSCPSCNSTRILVAPAQRKNIFYMLFPFFEKRKHICNDCKTVF